MHFANLEFCVHRGSLFEGTPRCISDNSVATISFRGILGNVITSYILPSPTVCFCNYSNIHWYVFVYLADVWNSSASGWAFCYWFENTLSWKTVPPPSLIKWTLPISFMQSMPWYQHKYTNRTNSILAPITGTAFLKLMTRPHFYQTGSA